MSKTWNTVLNEKRKKEREKNKGLECPLCNEFRRSAKGLFWHIRCDHGLSVEASYNWVGDVLSGSKGYF